MCKWVVDKNKKLVVSVETGSVVVLGEHQFKLLLVLLENTGSVLTKDYLVSSVWDGKVIGSSSLPGAIHTLRVAFGDNGKIQSVIKTIPKKGYKIENNNLFSFKEREFYNRISFLDNRVSIWGRLKRQFLE